MPHFDHTVVGAGILGLAHAYHLARRGGRVLVCDRTARAEGASVRNFGMLWPIGQPAGELYDLARRSLEIWQEVLAASGLWHAPVGSLHLAYHDDEAQVLQEFLADRRQHARGCVALRPHQVIEQAPHVNPAGLIAGLWSPHETCIDPREVIAGLPNWLSRELGVEFRFGCTVLGFDRPTVESSSGSWETGHLVVCSGAEQQLLYPDLLRSHELFRCKLQMMRSQPLGSEWRLGPMLAAGLTLQHYASFATCPSLSELRARFARELPEYGRYGIHVLASQNGHGEVLLGDSHEYDEAIEPFDKPHIDALVLEYLRSFLLIPELQIAARWHGIYVKHPSQPWLVAHPAESATLVTGIGGAGMTLSFGLAERVVGEICG